MALRQHALGCRLARSRWADDLLAAVEEANGADTRIPGDDDTVRAAIVLVATAISEALARKPDSRATVLNYPETVHLAISTLLHDPRCRPVDVAQACGMSRRSLDRALVASDRPPAGRLLRSMRQAVARDLAKDANQTREGIARKAGWHSKRTIQRLLNGINE